MTLVKISYPAPEGERFALSAFDSQIGKRVPVRMVRSEPGLALKPDLRDANGRIINAVMDDLLPTGSKKPTMAVLVASDVAQDGRSVMFTFDITPPPSR